jgi:sensor domain CHASE-containing protein
MSITEMIISLLPILLAIVVMVVVSRKAGVFQQREHRIRVEQLLERIANAVEKNERK